jgi:hypothetical protein
MPNPSGVWACRLIPVDKSGVPPPILTFPRQGGKGLTALQIAMVLRKLSTWCRLVWCRVNDEHGLQRCEGCTEVCQISL